MDFPSFFGFQEYRRRTPTTDLYLLNPLHYLRRRDPRGVGLQQIKNIAPNVYAIGRVGIISRYGSPRDLDRLRQIGATRIVYIADDDFEAGATDPHLPAPYRAKLAAFAQQSWPALREAADIVIVPSPALAALYGPKARLMHPAWNRPPAKTRHYREPHSIEIVHLGTGSHRADLALIAPVLANLLAVHKNVRVTLLAGMEAPAELNAHHQVRSRRQMPWWRYKHMMRRMRFHLAIYPLQETAFNRARSANKLFEHALLGAASLMSPNPALRDAAGPELRDIFVEWDPQQWATRLEADIADLGAARHRAERTASHILSSDPLGQAASQWLAILGMDT
jgi:hypothetical protein